MFPNPTSGYVRSSRAGTGSMVDLSGRQVLTFKNANEVDASSLPRGTYLMIFEDGDHKRLIISN